MNPATKSSGKTTCQIVKNVLASESDGASAGEMNGEDQFCVARISAAKAVRTIPARETTSTGRHRLDRRRPVGKIRNRTGSRPTAMGHSQLTSTP